MECGHNLPSKVTPLCQPCYYIPLLALVTTGSVVPMLPLKVASDSPLSI